MEDDEKWTGCECEYCSNEGDVEHCWALQRISELKKEIEKIKSGGKLEIDFNQLRLDTAKNLNDVISMLNSSIVIDEDMDRVVVPVNEIARHINSLRANIGTLLCIYETDNPDIDNVSEKIKIKEFPFLER
jgi:hypothetical protein